jgi:hypothetical protein
LKLFKGGNLLHEARSSKFNICDFNIRFVIIVAFWNRGQIRADEYRTEVKLRSTKKEGKKKKKKKKKEKSFRVEYEGPLMM